MSEHPKIHVYVINDGEAVKIGVGGSATKRRDQLQTGNPRLLVVSFVSVALPVLLAFSVEKEVHKRLKRWRMEAEWFATDPDTAELYVQECIVAKIFSNGC